MDEDVNVKKYKMFQSVAENRGQLPQVEAGSVGGGHSEQRLPCEVVLVRGGWGGSFVDCPGGTSVHVVGGGEFLQRGLHAPDLTGVLGDGAVAGELSGSGDVVDHLLGPFLGVLVEG